ncbi:DUF84 family protein [Dickeya oryzae]|uniref:DUF84 family protein n=1 Tax=Dickeya oryzae TaxID=1240404 RepID=UPI0012978119|nr:inosine/xanthosine triphosphatase [Dickeya oryzae]
MQNKHVTLLLASDNEAKISSVRNTCSFVFENFTLKHKSVESGVSETPQSDDEAISGCQTRIKNIELVQDSYVDYIIALEGLTEKTSFGNFVYGWAVIKDVVTSELYYGCSGKVMLPAIVAEKLDKKIKLSDIILGLNPEISQSDIDKVGTNGVLTGGLYTRVDEFETALKCAFGSLVAHKDFSYGKNSNF